MKRWIWFVEVLAVFLFSCLVILLLNEPLPRPQRNNNPLNIKYGEATKKWVENGLATLDPKPAQDGGYFLRFSTPEHGIEAAIDLLTSDIYTNLSIDRALRKWSGGGYGGEITPLPSTKRIKELTEEELKKLIRAMAKQEGYGFLSLK